MTEEEYIIEFKETVRSYFPVSDNAFHQLKDLVKFKTIKKDEILLDIGQISKHLYFVCRGAVIAYFVDEEGNTYNKNIFLEGMSIRLERELESLGRIRLRRVDSESDARLWSEIYPKSFGYAISATILLKTMVNIPFYLIYLDGQPIGTVIAYPTENAIGIHGLGILPQFRKQGFAEEAMGILLNNALHHNVQWATLQSSSMGKNMYLKLGFTEDFLMMTYKPS